MRIVIVTWEFPPRVIGNIAFYVERLASHLANGGSDVFVVTFHDSLRGVERLRDGVIVYRVGNPVYPHLNVLTWSLTLSAEIERAVSDIYYSVRGRIDLIDAQEWMSIVPSTVMKNTFNIPFIYSIDSLEEHRSNYADSPLSTAIKNLERLGTNESCRVLVKSEWMKTEVKRIHATADKKVIQISPDSPTWAAEIEESYQSVI